MPTNSDKLTRFLFLLLKEIPIEKLEPILIQADKAPEIRDFHIAAITKKYAQSLTERLLAPDTRCQIRTCSTPYTEVKRFKSSGKYVMVMCLTHRLENLPPKKERTRK
jgi:hypothetical protein